MRGGPVNGPSRVVGGNLDRGSLPGQELTSVDEQEAGTMARSVSRRQALKLGLTVAGGAAAASTLGGAASAAESAAAAQPGPALAARAAGLPWGEARAIVGRTQLPQFAFRQF